MMQVMTPEECAARQSIMLTHYVGSVEIEAMCMIDMINQHVIPSVKDLPTFQKPLADAVATLKKAVAAIHHEGDEKAKANLARHLRLETMIR
jgi:glutamine synthetase